MEGIEGTGPIKNNFSSDGLERIKKGPTDVEILNRERREGFGEKSVAEMFGPLSSKPFSDIGLEEVLERLSIEAVSSRN